MMVHSSAVVLSALLLLAGISASVVGLHVVQVQRKPKTLNGYLDYAHREIHVRSKVGVSAGPSVVDVGVKNSDFFANITVGTPPQAFSVLLNTYMTGLWIPSALCPANKYTMCKDRRLYYQNLSSSYAGEGQQARYGGMVANLSSDTVNIANLSVTNQSFAEVVEYNYKYSSIPYDGVFGLNMAQQVFNNDTSIFTNMVAQTLIDSIVYGLYFVKNSSDPSKSGGLVIGGRDPSLYVGDLTYVNSTSATQWGFTVDEVVAIGSGDMPPLCKDGCVAFPDTGSHFIVANHRLMDSLHRHLGAIAFEDNYTYHFNCSGLETLPPVYFSIGKALFKVPWQSYVDKVKGSGGEDVCLSSFVGLDDLAGLSWYLGDAFFASVYVEFDVDNQRIGFAQLRTEVGLLWL